MKKVCVLTIAVFFLLGGLAVFAESSPTTTTELLSMRSIEVVFYNAFGVALNSTRTITSKIKTTKKEEGKDDIVTETESVETITSSWRAGSLKVDSVEGTSETNQLKADGTVDPDGEHSTTESKTNYLYNEDGQLTGAEGGLTDEDGNKVDSITEGDEGKDANGKEKGTYKSYTTSTSVIKNGQLLTTESVTESTSYGADGEETSFATHTTANEYELIGGNWVITSSKTVTHSEGKGTQAGTKEDTVRTTTYNRDANGVVTGLEVEKTGTRTIQNGTGGLVNQKITSYTETVAHDAQQGYYVSKEVTIWDPA